MPCPPNNRPVRFGVFELDLSAYELRQEWLYRDGRDSVAWHGDRIARTVERPLVATISLGERRRFLLRPKGGGPSVKFEPGPGDLVVMGGTCQRTWQHCVPKLARAGPRMSVTVRTLEGGAL